MNILKFFLISLSISISNIIIGQEFAPIGAKWHYTERYTESGNIDYLMIESVKDTLLRGKSCRQLDCDGLCNKPSGIQFVQFSNDSLYFFDEEFDKFQLICTFNSHKGDMWPILVKGWDETIDTILVIVDSVKFIEINNQSLRQLEVTYNIRDYDKFGAIVSTGSYAYTSSIIEKIGDTNYFFNFPAETGIACDANYSGGLRCYEDAELGFYSTGIADSCTYTYVWVGIDEFNDDLGLQMYPNPSTDWIEIKLNSNIKYKITLFDLSGIPILTKNLIGDTRVDISNLQKGIYFIQFIISDNTKTIRKLVKE